MSREEVEELLAESNPEALFMDGFDDAIIGIAERPNFGPIVAYDEEKIIEILFHQMEASPEDLVDRTKDEVCLEMALEYYYYNVKSTWMGENTPIIITTKFYE
jgi:hypothetical protein